MLLSLDFIFVERTNVQMYLFMLNTLIFFKIFALKGNCEENTS